MNSDKWIVGGWDLVSFVSKLEDGSIEYPLGPQAKGIIMYTEFGSMAAALWRPGRPHVGVQVGSIPKLPFPRNIIPALKYVAGLRSYISYMGTYEIKGDKVFHHVKASLFADWVGTDLIRRYIHEPPLLTLIAEEIPGIEMKLVWKRSSNA
jgi:hypothetical protein